MTGGTNRLVRFTRPRIAFGGPGGDAALGGSNSSPELLDELPPDIANFLRLLRHHGEIVPGEVVRPVGESDATGPVVDGFVWFDAPPQSGRAPDGGSPGFGHDLGGAAAETDARLESDPIRHHFLTRVYAFAELRSLGPAPAVASLGDFQRRHKHLLMTYDQPAMRALGNIAADAARDARERYTAYARAFRHALGRMPARGAYVNALMHMYGHFKIRLSAVESEAFLATLDSFGDGRLALHEVTDAIAHWCLRFEYSYLADQSLLAPYPWAFLRTQRSPAGVSF